VGSLAVFGWSAVLIISLVLQSTLLEHPGLVARPDLLLVFVILWGFLRGSWAAAKLGIFFGLAEDLFLGKYIGLNLLSKALIGYGAGWVGKKCYRENLLLPLVGLLLGTPLYQFLYYILGSLAGLSLEPMIFARDTLIKSGYHSLIGFFIYPILLPRPDGFRLKDPGSYDHNRLRRS
jgi:rod shape-determining protein MreD